MHYFLLEAFQILQFLFRASKEVFMNIGEMADENYIQDKYTLYVRYYESCQKELDKLTQTPSQISFLCIITAAVAGLMFFLWYQQKNLAFLVPAFGSGFVWKRFPLSIYLYGRHNLGSGSACLLDESAGERFYKGNNFTDGS